MCRAGGRRCEHHWNQDQREYKNADRRIRRNTAKAEAARDRGDENKAGEYENLVSQATQARDAAEERMNQHDNTEPTPTSGTTDHRQGGEVLDSLNPTGTVFTGHGPGPRATAPLGPDMTTLAETTETDPDEEITVYRGVPTGTGNQVQAGDFITTNRMLAQDYAGTGQVIQKTIRFGDILDSRDEPEGEEYIYRPHADTELNP